MGILRKLIRILAEESEPKPTDAAPTSKSLNYDEVIRNHETRERQLNDMLSDQIEKIKGIEADLRRVFALYDQASPIEKKTYAVKIRSLNTDLETQGELRDSYEVKLRQEKAIIAKLRLNRVNSDMKIDQDEVDHIIEDALAAAAENETAEDKIDMLEGIEYHKKRRKRKSASATETDETEDINKIRKTIDISDETTGSEQKESKGDSEDIENIRKQLTAL